MSKFLRLPHVLPALLSTTFDVRASLDLQYHDLVHVTNH